MSKITEYDIPCPVCGAIFATRASLGPHMKVHSHERHLYGDGSESLATFRVLQFMSTAFVSTQAAPPETRCMGRGCSRTATVELRTIEKGKAAAEHPARLCFDCLAATDRKASNIDISRWLSDGRISADAQP